MKPQISLIAAALLAATLPFSATAKFAVKSYHQAVMSDANGKLECSTCHGDQKPMQVPSEQVCLDCHGSKQELAEATEPAGHGPKYEPNPHDSLHYGQDLACSYCHSQHQPTKVYCNQCHEFAYPQMKRD